MILALDIGNTQLFGGLFDSQGSMVFRFRKSTLHNVSSDEIGIFLRQVINENHFDYRHVTDIVISSVVPDIMHSLNAACIKYFAIEPLYLRAGLKTGLRITCRNPVEVGADRIANAIGATHLYPNENLLIIDFGTATTYCFVSKNRDYLGGLIMPGLRLSMEALEANTAKLPVVEIVVPGQFLGRSTVESIQNGLYYSALGTIAEVKQSIVTHDLFQGDTTFRTIGTGGFSRLFQDAQAFDHIESDLVLFGLYQLLRMNQTVKVDNTVSS